MKIIRYLDAAGKIGHASDGKKITGDIFGTFTVTNEKADVKKVFACQASNGAEMVNL